MTEQSSLEQRIEQGIAGGATQAEIAPLLADAIAQQTTVDARRVMRAVNDRWPKGRERILGLAWKIVKHRQRQVRP